MGAGPDYELKRRVRGRSSVLIAGVGIGLYLSFKKTPQDADKKVQQASAKVDELRTTAVAGAETPEIDQASATAATDKASEVKNVLGEISGIVGSLPENLRFAGLLVLTGTVLISVATVQFGGRSLF